MEAERHADRHSHDDPHEDVGVGVVECQLYVSLLAVQVGNTSLHLAAYHGFSRTLQQLLVHRANVHLVNTVTLANVYVKTSLAQTPLVRFVMDLV